MNCNEYNEAKNNNHHHHFFSLSCFKLFYYILLELLKYYTWYNIYGDAYIDITTRERDTRYITKRYI